MQKTFILLSLCLLLQYGIPVALAQPSAPTAQQFLEKGESLYAKGNLAEAIQYYNQVLAIQPNSTGAIYDKGLALDVLGKHEDAIAHYDLLLSIQPDNINALLNKGGALGDLGNF
jgi:tetratricopeptide (TPR) repeat protein